MSFNFSRLSTEESEIQSKKKKQYFNKNYSAITTSRTRQVICYNTEILPVTLVRFEVRSSSSLSNGELVARGLLTAVLT